MAIILVVIRGYSIDGYWLLFYSWLLVVILLMVIGGYLLMVIGGYLLMVIGGYLLMVIGGYFINSYWRLFY